MKLIPVPKNYKQQSVTSFYKYLDNFLIIQTYLIELIIKINTTYINFTLQEYIRLIFSLLKIKEAGLNQLYFRITLFAGLSLPTRHCIFERGCIKSLLITF